MKSISAMPFMLLAEASTANDSWAITLLNYGVAGAMLIWFMWRDKREGERQDSRHRENLEQQRKIEEAFRDNTVSIIVAMSTLKSVDSAHAELLVSLKSNNANSNPNSGR